MPIYEYRCENCGLKFEALRSMRDADNSLVCSNCQSVKIVRVLSTCNSKINGGSSRAGSSCSGCSGGSCGSCGR